LRTSSACFCICCSSAARLPAGIFARVASVVVCAFSNASMNFWASPRRRRRLAQE